MAENGNMVIVSTSDRICKQMQGSHSVWSQYSGMDYCGCCNLQNTEFVHNVKQKENIF